MRTRDKIYRLAGLEGHSQTMIAKAIKVSRQAVSRHIKNLISDGYIRPIGKGSPRTYKITKKAYPRPSKRDHRGRFPPKKAIRAHHTSRIFRIVKAPTRPLPWKWDRKWKASGVMSYVKRDLTIETREGPVSVKAIRLTSGPHRSSLTIYLDDDNLITSDQIRTHESNATETALVLSREIQLRSGMILALPEVMMDTHYAMPAPPDVVDTALEEGIRTDEVDFDRSMGASETETSLPEIAITWTELPNILRDLKDDISQIKTNMMGMMDITKEEIDTIKGLDKRTSDLEKALEDTKSGGMYQ